MLTIEEVTHVAELARLKLSARETEQFRGQLSAVLEYVERISSLDLTDVSPTHSVLSLPGALRADEVRESLPREELLRNAPETEAGCFRVPAILDEG
ncbi:MAG TPA: Asp-tRNA(Asn)/Glu-tRNA(Gln) amidotransferase subunit GatC [Anaerolineales bacterium]|jgi:aspartyl-tRNA(Asn)/glutamyl-tRNA(Gln) amidotransferase subunit C|nr:Asp-tRNA(Asn)/Glu-tRNA(Gln) amidotransferase subunit GatC [Anaerolineales bacterium]